MKVLLLVFSMLTTVCCLQAQAYLPAPPSPYTVTFDDIPPGADLSHYDEEYGLSLVPGWEVAEHSETNVLVWRGNPNFGAGFGFGHDPTDYPETTYLPYTVRLVGAHFSTEPGVLLEMIGYSRGAMPMAIASASIGSPTESWTDRYVEIFSETGDIAYVYISGVNSQEDRYHFSIDDLTISLVPEPSSLLALGGGLGAVGGLALRKRRS